MICTWKHGHQHSASPFWTSSLVRCHFISSWYLIFTVVGHDVAFTVVAVVTTNDVAFTFPLVDIVIVVIIVIIVIAF